jgi:hypothetical protein
MHFFRKSFGVGAEKQQELGAIALLAYVRGQAVTDRRIKRRTI